MQTKLLSIVSGIAAISLSGAATALPKGKPFQDLQAQIEANKQLIDANSQEIASLNESVDGINVRIDGVDLRILALEGQVSTNSDAIAEAAARLDTMDGDIAALTGDLAALAAQHAADMSSIEDRLNQLALDIAELHNLRIALAADLNAKLAALTSQVEANAADVNSALIGLVSVNAQLTSITSSIQDLESRHEALESTLALVNQALTILQARVTDLEAVTDTLSSYHLFTFSGIQNNLPVENLNGWTECYRATYADTNAHPENMIAACTGAKIMLACQQTGSDLLLAAAYANREDVFFDTGERGNVVHNANGVDWYYSPNYSMGFAPQGEGVLRSSADVQDRSSDQRLSWHTHDWHPNGWRCGSATGLNRSTAWQKVVYEAD